MQNTNQIKVTLNKETAEEIRQEMKNLPEYHCARGFLQECADAYTSAEQNYTETRTEEDTLLSSATKRIPITDLQREYLQSQDADAFFSTPVLAELLRQLREYRI